MQLTSIEEVQCLPELLITKAKIVYPTQSNPTQKNMAIYRTSNLSIKMRNPRLLSTCDDSKI